MTNELYDTLFSPHRDSDEPFLFLEDGTVMLYSTFLDLVAKIAGVLVTSDVNPGDRVAAQVAKTPEALALYVATVQAGAVFLPLNTAYKPAELAYFMENATPTLLVCDPGAIEALEPIAHSAGASVETLGKDGKGSLSEKARDQAPMFATRPRNGGDLAAILYTSGTTGRSKGAMLTHDNLLSNAQSLKETWEFTERDRLLHALPIFHTHGLFVAMNTVVYAGASMVFQRNFHVDKLIKALPSVTTMMGVPTFYTRLLNDSRFTRDLVSHMRLFISGSAPLLSETHEAFERLTGHRILERYGMTETNMNTSNPYKGLRKAGTVGFPLPGVEVRITGADNGSVMPIGEIGGIEVKGPNVFPGYWKMPKKTAEEFSKDGFFMTGDLGLIDTEGYVHIVGRSKDLIITGGYNVYPKEIELVLDQVDGVVESAVIGVNHADFGEAVVAVIITENGKILSEGALTTAISDNLASFKRPQKFIYYDQLPRNTMGKVQKNILREELADCL